MVSNGNTKPLPAHAEVTFIGEIAEATNFTLSYCVPNLYDRLDTIMCSDPTGFMSLFPALKAILSDQV